MKAAQYLKSLLPNFGRDQVLEDLTITKDEIKEVTQPAFEQAARVFKGWKFKSKVLETQFQTFDRLVKHQGSLNPIQVIAAVWPAVLQNLDNKEEMVKKHFSEEIAGAGLTYFKSNILQFVEAAAFVSKFARKFLNYVYVYETAEYEGGDEEIATGLTPFDSEWVAANLISFCTALNVVSGNPQQVQKQMSEIPEITVTSDNESTLEHTVGLAKLDPMQMRLIPLVMNPIYHVRMFVAEWQATRYKEAKEELKLLELRKLNLEKISEGKQDAAAQKQIEYMQGRVENQAYKLSKMEKAYG